MSRSIGNGIVGGAVLTHGTIESRQLPPARAFYEAGLGLRCVRHSPVSQLLAGAGEVSVVCVEIATGIHEQGAENRWAVQVGDATQVAATHQRIVTYASEWGLLVVEDPIESNGQISFMVRDADSNWWEVSNRPGDYYQKIFEGGEAA